jgi:hypothetical protein
MSSDDERMLIHFLCQFCSLLLQFFQAFARAKMPMGLSKKNSADWEEFEKVRRASVDSNQVSLDACNGAGAGGSSSLLHLGSIEDFSSFSPMTVACIPAEGSVSLPDLCHCN